MPGRDNETPFCCGGGFSISNLTKSETDETANGAPCSRPDVDGNGDGWLGDRSPLNCSSSM